ncbi:hypothetical protein C7T94_11110 [Pedobacter yulinensis]|uniref:Signal transduction histidine kinase internal region domain-containing protein n=1 Tax=Pedobacter yulinensis TaxID=2126353 RepID=A0A2T3HL41_9SPHI|nr:histidine kinase [Pedobacter yulinensis]PST83144.1 hypothetical protein C7T94_11110 [Pedobacter yulinensis]
MKRHAAWFDLSLRQLQWLVWSAVFVILFLSILGEDGLLPALAYSVASVVFSALIIYGNIFLLFPRLYEKGHRAWYVVASVIYVTGISMLRTFLVLQLYNSLHPEQQGTLTFSRYLYYITGGFLVYVLSFIFRMAIAYFSLKQQNERIITQKNHAEIALLKNRVQPHFLFNTLNNIYYEAYLEAPRTAALVDKLAQMMRYFVEESPKELVPISTEVLFLENYLALEQLRMRHPLQLSFHTDFNPALRIPPMLLMTFVENIFKHGVDKSRTDNVIRIQLQAAGSHVLFETRNTLTVSTTKSTGGFGLLNLRRRLDMLYPGRFVLETGIEKDGYKAVLKFPVT